MKIKILCILLVFTLINVNGQKLRLIGIEENKDFELFFKVKVKLLDEFIQRFNGDFSNLDSNLNNLDRLNKIKSLIDYSYYKKDINAISPFVKSIVSNNYQIIMSKPNWYSEVVCSFMYNRKEEQVVLNMQYETDEVGKSKWVIKGAILSFVDIDLKERKKSIFINPVNNETYFSEFNNYLNEKYAFSLLGNEFNFDQLSVFLYLVKNKDLMFKQVNSIKYVFYTGNFRFEVKEFNRQNYNSGWLISLVAKDLLPFPIIDATDKMKLKEIEKNQFIIDVINSKYNIDSLIRK